VKIKAYSIYNPALTKAGSTHHFLVRTFSVPASERKMETFMVPPLFPARELFETSPVKKHHAVFSVIGTMQEGFNNDNFSPLGRFWYECCKIHKGPGKTSA